METTSRDGFRIAFETVGSGDPLVLLHGFFGDGTSWRSAGHVDALADAFRLVLVDGRGHGGSDAPRDVASYRMERHVDDVIDVLDALGIDRAAFWGASQGGTVGLHLLARHPERLTGVVAGGAHAGAIVADPEEVEREAEEFLLHGTGPSLAWVERQGPVPEWMRAAIRAAEPHALAATTRALAHHGGVLDALAACPVPVLLLAGDRDPRLPTIRHTAERVPHATLVELPDCGHFDAFARSDLTVPAVRSFLATAS